MKKLLLILLIVICIATPAYASYYHEITIEVEGEWTIDSNFAAPEVTSNFALTGTGKAIIHAITAAKEVPGDWWKLF
jgi:hypothetical protein